MRRRCRIGFARRSGGSRARAKVLFIATVVALLGAAADANAVIDDATTEEQSPSPSEATTPPESAGPQPAEDDATLRRRTLAEEFSDPLTTLPQLFVQDVFTPANFGTDGRANRVIARAIVPRIPKLSLLPFVQLIRPSISLVTFPTGKGRGTETAFGDFQLFDLAVLPWPDHSTGLYMGAGPVMIFPTATDDRAGQGGTAWRGVGMAVPRGMGW